MRGKTSGFLRTSSEGEFTRRSGRFAKGEIMEKDFYFSIGMTAGRLTC